MHKKYLLKSIVRNFSWMQNFKKLNNKKKNKYRMEFSEFYYYLILKLLIIFYCFFFLHFFTDIML